MSPAEVLRRFRARLSPRWPAIRAALVGYHVLAVLALSFPAPPGNLQRRAWENPTIQDEIRSWAESLRSAGLNITAKELDAAAFGFATRFSAARSQAVAPFEPYATLAGARQNWHLFAGPQRYPMRLVVSIREGGTWRTIYSTRSDEAAWRSGQLERYRMRRAISMTLWGDPRQFQELTDWIAAQVARDFPAATDVMVRQYRFRTPTVAEALAGKTEMDGKYTAREARALGAR